MNRRIMLAILGCSTMVGCGEPFIAGGGGSGGQSTSSGGSGGSGGTTACTPSGCEPSHYCSKNTGVCQPCDDLSSLSFRSPKKIILSPPISSGEVLFPRMSPVDRTLYFAYIDRTTKPVPPRHLASAALSASSQGTLAWGTWKDLPGPIRSDKEDSGPLVLANGAMLATSLLTDPAPVNATDPVLLFDSKRNGTSKIFVANLKDSTVSEVTLSAGTNENNQVAAAPEATPPRLFWMSNAQTQPTKNGLGLVTMAATGGATPEPVVIQLDSTCEAKTISAPWVTSDGTLLLFAVDPLNGCGVTNARLFLVRLDPTTGKVPAGEVAHPLFSDEAAGYDVTPSLSPDRCSLLFSRYDENSNAALYAALRE